MPRHTALPPEMFCPAKGEATGVVVYRAKESAFAPFVAGAIESRLSTPNEDPRSKWSAEAALREFVEMRRHGRPTGETIPYLEELSADVFGRIQQFTEVQELMQTHDLASYKTPQEIVTGLVRAHLIGRAEKIVETASPLRPTVHQPRTWRSGRRSMLVS